ncbi:hypothetical protein [Ralstonia solanacearum]|uniref:hypothetical protein n=1 Tax=Ralstonia solanacearum TaxID=305 RepID=UPI000A4319F9|nr:hypothetical protein [Ralstonia solanacearum]
MDRTPVTSGEQPNACKSLLTCIFAATVPLLAACTLGGAVAGGIIGHELGQ